MHINDKNTKKKNKKTQPQDLNIEASKTNKNKQNLPKCDKINSTK